MRYLTSIRVALSEISTCFIYRGQRSDNSFIYDLNVGGAPEPGTINW